MKIISYVKDNMYASLLTILLFVAVFYLFNSYNEESLRSFIFKAGVWAPLVFVLILLFTLVFAPLGGTPILYVGYQAFGINVIFLATLVSYISFIINFEIAKRRGRPIVRKLVGEVRIEKIDKIVSSHGLWTLFLLRVFQGGIHDFVSYAYGVTSIHFLPYFVISVLATIPGTAIWYYLTTHVQSAEAFTLINWGLVLVFAGLYMLGSFTRKILLNKTK